MASIYELLNAQASTHVPSVAPKGVAGTGMKAQPSDRFDNPQDTVGCYAALSLSIAPHVWNSIVRRIIEQSSVGFRGKLMFVHL